jgi:methylated-DNA-[protein]-cysteine S-methyltransferase
MPPTPTLVATSIVDAPWGPIRIAATDTGVVALEALSPPDTFLERLARRGLVPALAADAAPAGPARDLALQVAELIARHLRGERPDLTDLPVDLRDRPDWDRLVLGSVAAIPFGETASYGEVARRIGRSGAARAVGGAVGRNPVGILVPCHRVIAGDGSLGGYGVAAYGGREAALDVKRALLALEGVSPG